MTGAVQIGETTEAVLVNAILLYQVDGNGACATVHEVLKGKGAPQIGPGEPVTSSFLRSLVKNLDGKSAVEFLPENVLVRTQRATIWWTPAKRRKMFFGGAAREYPEVKGISGKQFPHPPLLWVVDGVHLTIRALKADARPLPGTPTFRAPYWNTNDQGEVCQGSMRKPSGTSLDALAQWEKAYFESQFTHPTGNLLTRFEGGAGKLWASLAGSKDGFPLDTLIPVKGETVGSIVKGL